MSNVSTIHASLVASLASLFPSKTVIPNPFSLEDNNQNLLKDGYGYFYGPAGLPDFDLGIHIQGYSRDFNIVMTKNVYRTDISPEPFVTTQLALLEDQNTLVNSFADIRNLDQNVVSIEFVSDSGVEFIFADKNNYLALTTTFAVSYREDKTYT